MGESMALRDFLDLLEMNKEASRVAMMASMNGEPFEDVRFYAYSRRDLSGNIDTPRPIFANSKLILAASSHFESILTQSGAEDGITDMNRPSPAIRPSSILQNEYLYADDSDLEEEPTSSTSATEERLLPSPLPVSADDQRGGGALRAGGEQQQEPRKDQQPTICTGLSKKRQTGSVPTPK
ncbi:hypothetical protein C8Q74DRAFT_716642 [Fomes fomentarius]|nr:hypothetical protein C8Q74DRAFT_716642 [Fomes fomentarius]